jgi:preprotein translocase subunit SecD
VPILILVIAAIVLYVDFWPGARFFSLSNVNAGLGSTPETKLGLDIQGGFEIKYRTVDSSGNPVTPTAAQLEVVRSIMENRVNSTGVSEPIVETAGSNEILVQLPGVTDADQIRALVGQTGQLSFVLLPRETYGYIDTTTGSATAGSKPVPAKGDTIDPNLPAQFTGAQLDTGTISAAIDTTTNDWAVNFGFGGTAAGAFESWSGQHIGDYFAIVLDTKVISAPYLKSQITGGKGQISGSFTQASAKELATILQYGALPFPVQEEDYSSVPATLGASFLQRTLLAGGIGIFLVLIFMLIYYRLPGLIASFALAYYAVAVLAVFRIIPVTLTLAGIAGFVLTVGMAVDANILIFERTKEELRTGKTLVTAMEAGFNRAWNSIFDSNVSSLITAGILYFGGSSTIKGFALVLAIGVAISMFTAVTVSRTLLRIVVHSELAQRAWLYGVTEEEFQAKPVFGRYGRREARDRV